MPSKPVVSYKTVVTNVKAKQNKKAKKPTIKHSNFIFTVNTNQRIGPYEEDLEPFCDRLKESFDDMFSNLHDYVTIMEPEHEWSTDYIKKVEAECEGEFLNSPEFNNSSRKRREI